jgi:hypothetical protein
MKFEISDVESEVVVGPRDGVAGPDGWALVSSFVFGNLGSWVR